MGREIRKVPKDWEHPKNDRGNYQPLHDEFYLDALAEWLTNHNAWLNGTHEDLVEKPSCKDEMPFYAMWNGDPPSVEYYRHQKWTEEQANCFQMYETVSEGTPVSPVFETLKQLEDWLVKDQGHSRKAAHAFCESSWAPSMTMTEGKPGSIKMGVDTYDD